MPRAAILIAVTFLLVAGGVVFMFVALSSQDRGGQTTPDTQRETNPSDSQDHTNATYPVKVFFSKQPESDDDPTRVFPVERVSPDLRVGTFAIQELLKGPTQEEAARGYFTTAKLREGESTCGGQDFRLTIENGTATLQFCRVFDHLGSVADGQAESEIKATLRQFGTVGRVVTLNPAGDCEFDLSGLNLCKQ